MINEPFDYSMYGTWNGKPMLPICNREQKRKYLKEHKKDKYATHCDYCKGKTLTITDDYGKCVCELCGRFKMLGFEIMGETNER